MKATLNQCWLDFLAFFSLELGKREKIQQIKDTELQKLNEAEQSAIDSMEKSTEQKTLEISNAEQTITKAAEQGDLEALKKKLESLEN